MSSPSNKPDWFAKKQKTKVRSTAAQQKKKPLRMRRTRKPTIKVHPEDLVLPTLSFWNDLKRDAKHGLRGMIGSIVIHVIVLTILALIVITIQSDRNDYLFEMGWTPEPVAAMAQKARGPVNVGAMKLNPDSPVERKPLQLTKDKTGGSDEETPDDKPASEGIKPVNVDQLLSLRNPELRKEIVKKHGGGISTEKTIEEALLWLKRQQSEGGSWILHDGYPDDENRNRCHHSCAAGISRSRAHARCRGSSPNRQTRTRLVGPQSTRRW
jgi:hypothetical protein